MNPSTRKYNKEFREIKPEIFNRDQWQCKLDCDNNDGILDCHHIIARGQGGKNIKENLITLCRTCHNKIELLPRKESILLLTNILRDIYNYIY